MENTMEQQEIWLRLKKLYNESENKIKTSAIINRAYTEKISNETINEKVEAQLNAIKIGIYEINPRFKEGAKNYEPTKKLILESMENYEQALRELSEFYDGKIEQLIIRKVELQANLVGSIINEQYLANEIRKKDDDKVKNTITSTIKKALEKLTKKKKEKEQIDIRFLEGLQDGKELEIELNEKIDYAKEEDLNKQKDNKASIEKIEKEIRLIDEEIKKINERKKQSLYNAMEVGDKYLVSTIKKPKMFKKITRFFISKFNTPKLVANTILNPLNERIENFRNNELSTIKG